MSCRAEASSGWATLRTERSSLRRSSVLQIQNRPLSTQDYFEEPVVFLSFDTPGRDPKDVIFVNPEDGTPESFVRRKEL